MLSQIRDDRQGGCLAPLPSAVRCDDRLCLQRPEKPPLLCLVTKRYFYQVGPLRKRASNFDAIQASWRCSCHRSSGERTAELLGDFSADDPFERSQRPFFLCCQGPCFVRIEILIAQKTREYVLQ